MVFAQRTKGVRGGGGGGGGGGVGGGGGGRKGVEVTFTKQVSTPVIHILYI